MQACRSSFHGQTLTQNFTRKGILGHVVSRLRRIWQGWRCAGEDGDGVNEGGGEDEGEGSAGGDKTTVDNLA